MDKYLENKNPRNGEIIKSVFLDLYNTNQYSNVLFVRTPTTGDWQDTLLPNNESIIRILYNTNKVKRYICHKSTIKVDNNDFENYVLSLNKKFDIIIIDPFHEYYESKRDLFLLTSLLSDNGVIICHDCYPKKEDMAIPKFFLGPWSGRKTIGFSNTIFKIYINLKNRKVYYFSSRGDTYIALIVLSFTHPNFYFGVLNTDTGVGIMSKQEIEGLTNNFDREKQEIILNMHRENDVRKYKYFCENSKDLINVINPK